MQKNLTAPAQIIYISIICAVKTAFLTDNISERGITMAKAMEQSTGCKASGKVTKAKTAKPKKLSKIGEWWLAHPNGLDVISVDMRAVLK